MDTAQYKTTTDTDPRTIVFTSGHKGRVLWFCSCGVLNKQYITLAPATVTCTCGIVWTRTAMAKASLAPTRSYTEDDYEDGVPASYGDDIVVEMDEEEY
jgi:hypothetical protein